MAPIDSFRSSRVYVARVYADAAGRLAAAIEADPAADLWPQRNAVGAAWRALCDIEQAITQLTFAGDPIDDFYREDAVAVDDPQGPLA